MAEILDYEAEEMIDYIKLHHIYLDNLKKHYPELVEEPGDTIEELNCAINDNFRRVSGNAYNHMPHPLFL